MAENQLALLKRDTADVVAGKVRAFQDNGELHFPADYSPENALKGAWLTLQDTKDKDGHPALQVCTKDSIANSLLNMVVQGLNPIKKQCYFIVYGRTLTLQRSYFGTMYVAKMVDSSIDDITADVIYEGDEFVYKKERGRTVVVSHEQRLENIDSKKIVAAYCSIFYNDGTERTTIMTIDEIKQAWRQSKMNPVDDKGNIKSDSTHGKFTADMAMKTVVNRACKTIINSSNDSSLVMKAYRNTEDAAAEAEVERELLENANQTVLTISGDTGEVMEAEGTAPDLCGEYPRESAVDMDDLP